MKRHLQVDDKIVRVVIHNQEMIRTIYLDTISIRCFPLFCFGIQIVCKNPYIRERV